MALYVKIYTVPERALRNAGLFSKGRVPGYALSSVFSWWL
jgi:hypothetical protein